jgi:hypothetical protein
MARRAARHPPIAPRHTATPQETPPPNFASAAYSRRPGRCVTKNRSLRSLRLLLEQEDRKARHLPEVTHVCGEHGEVQRKSRRSNQEVRVRNDDAADSLLSIQSPREQSRLFRVGIYLQTCKEIVEKRLPTQAQRWSIGAVKSMDQFGQSHCR